MLMIAAIGGCSAAPRTAAYLSCQDRAPANLVLGPTQDHTFLAEAFTERSAWPCVDSGIMFDDVSTYAEIIDDDQSFVLCRDIARKIERDLSYPGQIKVTVIRETRAIDYAK